MYNKINKTNLFHQNLSGIKVYMQSKLLHSQNYEQM